ncbi:helix-turn-helix domain-containing protein [Halopiger goleimassiliensis]|uniref:helix-turn-helix domain-containing protein n=1 Tax=Halopiger goleimassiliensis TaxID=1293048 RepID=UPI000677D189|nr:helix-turn-helix domain-containing protein [Halopiger goleimassiliensis]
MDAVETTVPTESPTVEELMRDVFDISPTELEVRQQVMAAGETTIDDLVETVDRDRSVVSRHLNHLVDLGVVEKTSRVLPEGGRVNVYAPRSEDVVRRKRKHGLYASCLDAIELLEEVNEEKIAMMAENPNSDDHNVGRSVVDRLLSLGDSS